MFRDKGPTHNLGHGVSSRDMPSREGETETPSPNSGYVAKALDAHPMMRFFASAGTAKRFPKWHAGVFGTDRLGQDQSNRSCH